MRSSTKVEAINLTLALILVLYCTFQWRWRWVWHLVLRADARTGRKQKMIGDCSALLLLSTSPYLRYPLIQHTNTANTIRILVVLVVLAY